MSEVNPIQNPTEKQKSAEAIPAAALEWGVGPLLNAQADLLAGAEATVTDWLHRRHEAIVDTQQLISACRPAWTRRPHLRRSKNG